MKYLLGLDIGITSVGWAVLNLDAKRIENLGVRAFNAAEDPQSKAPLAEPRRLARSMRRRLRRRAGRLRRAKELFVQYGLVASERDDDIFLTKEKDAPTPYEIRAKGLDHLLTGEEFARALFHIIKRRGFKSNRKKAAPDNQDDKRMLGSISENRRIMEEKGYRTVGEMLCLDEKFRDKKRNGQDSYENTFDREMMEDEIKVLFSRQRELGSQFASEEFEESILQVFNWQMPFASGDKILKLTGKCTFEPDELRAPKYSYHAERFTLLQSLNNLRYTVNGDVLQLDAEQKKQIIEMAYTLKQVTYKQIRNALGLPEAARFNSLRYLHRNKDTKQMEESLDCEKSKFVEMKGYHAIKEACESAGVWDKVKNSPDLMDDIAFALTFYKTDEDISRYLEDKSVDPQVIDAVLGCGQQFSGVKHISTKAIKKLIPYMENGLRYDEACAAVGYDHSNPRSSNRSYKLPVVGDAVSTNPVVRRALSQARKVVNAIIDRYGSPYIIRIELAREMGKSAEKRNEIKRQQDENARLREERRREFIEKFGREPSGEDVLKYRLYVEQGGKCAYSLQPIDINRLFEPGYTQIDHIIPYSRSFDDSMSNKVLCLGSENQKKRDRIPYEVFGHDQKRWEEYERIVPAMFKDLKKRRNLLCKEFNEDEWKERSLSDTKWIAREFANFVREHLQFADPEVKKPVRCVNGQVVAYMRRLWGLEKHREEDDLHHALDAAVIATITDWQIQAITDYAKASENPDYLPYYVDEYTGEVIENKIRLPQPWPNFRKELLARLSEDPAAEIAKLSLSSYAGFDDVKPIMVSRMPQRKVSGPIHEETIRSVKKLGSEGKSVVKRPLLNLSKSDLDNLFDPDSNKVLYALIRERMERFDYEAKKAFAEPLYKPRKDGTPGPIVKSVKVCQTQNTGIEVRGGIADNGRMVRIDVSRKSDKHGKFKWYATPIYVSNFMRGELPDVPGEFVFSLYPYDLIRLRSKGGVFFGYYRGYNINTDSLTICEANNVQRVKSSIGIRNAYSIEKFYVDVLGDYYPIRREVRRGLENGGDFKSGEAEDSE